MMCKNGKTSRSDHCIIIECQFFNKALIFVQYFFVHDWIRRRIRRHIIIYYCYWYNKYGNARTYYRHIATGCSGASRAHILYYCGYSHRRVDLWYDKTWTAACRRVKPLFDETGTRRLPRNSVIEFLWWFEGSDVIC